VKGVSENIKQKNRIRMILRDFFPERECYCLVRPSEDEDTLQNMTMADSDVRPEFLQGINEVKQLISSQVSLKQVNGNLIDGSCLVSLAEA